MGAVTYPDPKVISFITDHVIPLQVLFDNKPLAMEFGLKWTPTLITLDVEGKEHYRTVGFLGPDELIPSLLLGIGAMHFERGEFDEAIAAFDRLLKEHPKSDQAAQGIFFRGVALYKSRKDPKSLREAYDKLSAEYPDSQWTRRAFQYRLIT